MNPYTPPPEPMSDRQFYIVVGALMAGFAIAGVAIGVVTWIGGVFAR